MFINLGVKSYYSILCSSISIDEIIAFALLNKQTYVSLIDKNVMYGAIEFYLKATKNNLQPIIGLNLNFLGEEIYLIALNFIGYKKLCKISSIINCNLNEEWLQYVNNDLVVIASQDKLKNFSTINKYTFANLAFHEALFVKSNDYEKYKAIIALKNGVMYDEVKDDETIKAKYLLNEQQANKLFNQEQLSNLNQLLKKINLKINLNQENYFVKFDPTKDSFELLKERCRFGLINKIGQKVQRKYLDRINYELNIIHQMGFDDYFLVVQDYVAYAKQNNIMVGPGRGSAAGSLVSYVLDITDIDPLKYDLIFERFLNKERHSKPDIDVDFMDSRRNEVIDYIFAKYGHNHVAHIITFQKIKIKMAIRDIGRILNFDLKVINLICKKITLEIEKNFTDAIKSNKELIELVNQYPKLFNLAQFLIGLPRQIGTHAAGIVIANQDMTNIVPICYSNDGITMTQYSMEYIESVGLIKLDILGLVNLSIINDCLDEIYKNKKQKIEINKIDFHDQKVFKMLQEGKTIGIFQLEGKGMTNIAKKLAPKSIQEISDVLALFRPGPQDNIPIYLYNKNHSNNMTFINQKLKSILLSTYGIILYQEQIMQIVQIVANYSLNQADSFRYAISKKKLNKLIEWKNDFLSKAINNGYTQNEAQEIFTYILKFANYGFNKSHSLAYSIISYQMAYLKVYFPLEFYACLLTYNNNSLLKINTYLFEAKKNNIKILPPSIIHSLAKFSLYQNKIIFGFSAIKGIGIETIEKIIKWQKQKLKINDLFDVLIGLINQGIEISSIKILVKSGCFDDFFNNNIPNRTTLLKNLDNFFNSLKFYSEKYGILNFSRVKISKSTNEQINFETSEQANLLGFNFIDKQISFIKKQIEQEKNLSCLIDIKQNLNYLIIAKVLNVKNVKTKNNTNIAWITLEDETMIIDDIIAFNNVLNDSKQNCLLQTNNFLLIELSVYQSSKNKLIKVNKIIRKINILS